MSANDEAPEQGAGLPSDSTKESQRPREVTQKPPSSRRRSLIVTAIVLLALVNACSGIIWHQRMQIPLAAAATPATPSAPAVTVSLPKLETIAPRAGFLGQFSALDSVEIRAQVGGILTEIHFEDGQLVKKGNLLFVIDPRPYEIKLVSAVSAVRTAEAEATLAQAELWRAQQLKATSFGTAETVDQRVSTLKIANAAADHAASDVRNATLDLEYSHVVAPFNGRVSNHRISVGSLISGSRAGTSPTTLLTTIVSTDPIYLNFDMSENDYLAFARAHPNGELGEEVDFKLSDEEKETRQGKLDFIDNAIDRSSGTIHARAICPNPDGFLKPGSFARLSLVTGEAHPALLVPETALQLDQSDHVLMTVDADNTVVPKIVSVGGIYGGMRAITSGLLPTDRVIVDGLMRAMPGAKVAPEEATTPAKDRAP